MIKRLKRNKGFTLVELIVVIAIVGILTSILLPSLLGYAERARVSTANTTAGMLRDEVNRWLLDLNTKGVGMLYAEDSLDYLEIVYKNGKWQVKTNIQNSDAWNMVGEGHTFAMKSDILLNTLNLNYHQSQPSAFTAYLVGGYCKYLAFNSSSDTPITSFGSYSDMGTIDWIYSNEIFSNDGVLKDGTIIGTAPAITR